MEPPGGPRLPGGFFDAAHREGIILPIVRILYCLSRECYTAYPKRHIGASVKSCTCVGKVTYVRWRFNIRVLADAPMCVRQGT